MALMLCLSAIAQSPDANGIVYVKKDGTGNGASWANATSNLQGAINSGATKVFVAIGNYPVGASSFIMKNNVAVYGGFDPQNGITALNHNRILPNKGMGNGSVLDGENTRPVIWNEYTAANPLNNTAVLDGFTITRGVRNSSSGGGIYNYFASPTLTNLVISGNSAFQGGGISGWKSSPIITNVSIIGNTATAVGYYGGGGFYHTGSGSSPVLTNVLIANNTGGGVVADDGGSVTFNNVTISGNTAPFTPSILSLNTAITLSNSIVFGDISAGFNAYSSLIEGYSNTTNGNINASGIGINDVFINPTMGNYTLKSTSPLINRGINTLFAGLNANTKDLAGNLRWVGSAIDIGAYEFPFEIIPDANSIVYVRETVMGNGTGVNWANATADLHHAMQAIGVQKVFVAVGNYPVGANSFIMKNGVAIYGGFDPVNGITVLEHDRIMPNPSNSQGSILDGQNTRPVIWNVFTSATAMDNTAVLDGFTIYNGTYTDGGGIRNVYASPTLRNLVIRGNGATQSGAGISNSFSSPVISNSVISGNVAINALGNVSGAGMTNTNFSTPRITNTTITGNQLISSSGTMSGAGIYNAGSSVPLVYNSIIWNNQKNNNPVISGTDIENNGANITLKNSITQGFTTGNANDNNLINTNPLFTGTDFKISDLSPAINAGNNALFAGLNATTKDLAGNPRLSSQNVDMGAFEFQTVIAPDNNSIIYVKPNATGNGTGVSWENATNDLYNAIHVTGVQKVFVAVGEYKVGDNSFVMKNNVEIYGGFDPDNNIKTLNDTRILPSLTISGSVLNGKNERPVLWNDNNGLTVTAILDGFTVTNGTHGNKVGGMYNNYVSPTISNCVFSGNSSGSGIGAMDNNYSSPIITKCIFSANSGYYAGGLYNSNASPTIIGCTFSTNIATAYTSGNGGGAMFNFYGSPSVTNCIFSGNTGGNGGAVNGYFSSPSFYNTLFSGNKANYGGAIFSNSGATTLINCTIVGNYAGNDGGGVNTKNGTFIIKNSIVYSNINNDIKNDGNSASITVSYSNYATTTGSITDGGNNITDNPLFVNLVAATSSEATISGNYTLQSISPAINKGSNALFIGLDANTKDLAGNARVYKYAESGLIDLGAYEYQDSPVSLPVSLIGFMVKADGDRAKLQWQTASETNNLKFILYRSGDGNTFIQIGERLGAGTSTAINNYVFYDHAPLEGVNYYQLVQIDNNGKVANLGIRSLNFALQAADLRLFPNPTADQLNIVIEAGVYSKLELIDLNGNVLQRIGIGISETNKIVSLAAYPAGTYLIRISGKAQTLSKRVAKVR
jgi:trimeric autotransporter adhesin